MKRVNAGVTYVALSCRALDSAHQTPSLKVNDSGDIDRLHYLTYHVVI